MSSIFGFRSVHDPYKLATWTTSQKHLKQVLPEQELGVLEAHWEPQDNLPHDYASKLAKIASGLAPQMLMLLTSIVSSHKLGYLS